MQIAKHFVFLSLFLSIAMISGYAEFSEGNFSSHVEGVNPINGSFTQTEIDLTVAGPEPLVLTRFYNSQETTTNFGGWKLFPQCHLSHSEQESSFELTTDGGGKRIYIKHPSVAFYVLDKEILPSGNRVLYDYDELGRIVLVKMTNSSGEKIFSWIVFKYRDCISVEASDGKSIEYHFNGSFLQEVIRSDKPSLKYQYNSEGLLFKKEFLEGDWMEISYDEEKKYNSSNLLLERINTPSSSFNIFKTRVALKSMIL